VIGSEKKLSDETTEQLKAALAEFAEQFTGGRE
jgi:hypothetical protein